MENNDFNCEFSIVKIIVTVETTTNNISRNIFSIFSLNKKVPKITSTDKNVNGNFSVKILFLKLNKKNVPQPALNSQNLANGKKKWPRKFC